jgi:fluoride exporter
MIARLAVVAVGEEPGAAARYAVSGWAAKATQHATCPCGTLVVNVSGALLLGGLIGTAATGSPLVAPRVRALLGIGFLGAFTTFSTLTYETVEALRAGVVRIAAVNVAASLAVGRGACWLVPDRRL